MRNVGGEGGRRGEGGGGEEAVDDTETISVELSERSDSEGDGEGRWGRQGSEREERGGGEEIRGEGCRPGRTLPSGG